jgi:hypothetical protein
MKIQIPYHGYYGQQFPRMKPQKSSKKIKCNEKTQAPSSSSALESLKKGEKWGPRQSWRRPGLPRASAIGRHRHVPAPCLHSNRVHALACAGQGFGLAAAIGHALNNAGYSLQNHLRATGISAIPQHASPPKRTLEEFPDDNDVIPACNYKCSAWCCWVFILVFEIGGYKFKMDGYKFKMDGYKLKIDGKINPTSYRITSKFGKKS